MKFLILLALLVLLVVGYASTRPDTFRIERSVLIKASPEKIYPLITDFGKWQAWSPWEKKDPCDEAQPERPRQWRGRSVRLGGEQGCGFGHAWKWWKPPPSSLHPDQAGFSQALRGPQPGRVQRSMPKGDQTEVVWAMSGPSALDRQDHEPCSSAWRKWSGRTSSRGWRLIEGAGRKALRAEQTLKAPG